MRYTAYTSYTCHNLELITAWSHVSLQWLIWFRGLIVILIPYIYMVVSLNFCYNNYSEISMARGTIMDISVTSNERHGVSNHWQLKCSIIRLFGLITQKTSKRRFDEHLWAWIQLTKCQLCEQLSHVMTSTCFLPASLMAIPLLSALQMSSATPCPAYDNCVNSQPVQPNCLNVLKICTIDHWMGPYHICNQNVPW